MFTYSRALSGVSVAVLSIVGVSSQGGAAPVQPPVSANASALAPAAVLTDMDNGSTVTATLGATIAVKLSANATPGASWKLASISTPDAKLVGAITADDAGPFTATFATVTAGTSLVTLILSTSGGAPLRTFTFELTVETDAATVTAIGKPATAAAVAVAPAVAKFVPNSFVTADTTVKYVDGSSYTGGLKQGIPAGPGTYVYTAGNTRSAQGTWSGRQLTGGHITMVDGVQYSGDLNAEGNPDGPARFDYPNGSVLTTTFTNGDYSGPSTLTTPIRGSQSAASDIVTVNVIPPSPMLTGPATETFANGSTVTGTMTGGKFDGPATFTPATKPGEDKAMLHSSFVDGTWQGPYTWIDSDGSRLSGTIKNGSLQGRAIETASDGKKCGGQLTASGDFVAFSGPVDDHGHPNGRGRLGCPGDEIYSGFYSHGKMVGVIYDHQTDGTLYVVDVGSKPTTQFVGSARVKLPNGNVATGHLTPDGKLTGAGTYQFNGGQVRHGHWDHGVLIGADEG